MAASGGGLANRGASRGGYFNSIEMRSYVVWKEAANRGGL